MAKSGEVVSRDEGIWAVSGDLRLMPGVVFPVTCTIVKLADGGLLLHSPIGFSDETAAAIGKLGEVSTIFAPNLFHNSFLQKAHEQFPDAKLVAPLGMIEKLKKLSFDELVGAGESRALGADFDHVFVAGAPKFNEIVLRHKKTNSLIVADYFFNINEVRGLFTKFILTQMSDAFGVATQSKLWHKVVKDKSAAAKSAREVLALDFGRIYPSHGDPIDDGRACAVRGLKWLVDSEGG